MGFSEVELGMAAQEVRQEHETLKAELPNMLTELSDLLPDLDINQCREIKKLVEEIKEKQALREKDKDRIDF